MLIALFGLERSFVNQLLHSKINFQITVVGSGKRSRSARQSCKMDCENCDNCEIANCDCEEIAISQITQFDFEKASQFRK